MENIINKYPYITSDFSQLIKFSFNKILKHFNQKICMFKYEYYFLINVNKSLFIQKDNNDLKLIDEIINSINNIKTSYKSVKIRLFSYKKYVKEIIKIKRDDEIIDNKNIIDLLIKEIDENPQSDIILSLSDLYMKIEQYLIRGKNEKNKIMKIIIINNENEKKNNINEKEFEIKNVENILKIFINEKSIYFGVEFIYLNYELFKNKINENLNNLEKIIYENNEMLKKAENLNIELYDKWKDINSNEDIIDGIKKLDELVKFFKNVLNSVFFIKDRIKKNKEEKIREIYSQKIEDYITSNNLNNIKEGIVSSDINESFIEELNNYKKIINEININNYINDENQINKNIKSIYIDSAGKYLLKQKEYIFQFLGILEKSSSFIDSIEKEIFKQTKDIIIYDNIGSEKSKEEENDEEEIK